MSNQDFDFDPDAPPGDDSVAWIRRQQQQALANTWPSPDDDPDRAKRAMDLSRSTGVPASLIYGDQENFERQHKMALTSTLLRNNKFLMDYAADPIKAKASDGDWGALDEYTEALGKLGKYIGPTHGMGGVGHAAIKAAVEHFDTERAFAPIPQPPDWISNSRLLTSAWNAAFGVGGPGFGFRFVGAVPEVFGAGLAGVQAGSSRLFQVFGVPEQEAESLSRDLVGMIEARMMQMEGAPHIPHEALPPGLTSQIRRSLGKAAPYLQNGEIPPPYNNSITDEVHRLEAQQADKTAKEIFQKAHATSTIDTPEAFEALSREVVGNGKMGISASALSKLYGDETPSIGDGKLGDLADVRDGYEQAIRGGRDINVPIAEFIAKAPEDVKEDLREGLRWHGGMTLEEAKKPPLPTEAEPPAPEGIPKSDYANTLDTVRESSGVVPMARPRPVLPPEGVIPPTSLLGQEVDVRGLTVPAQATFPLKEGLARIKTETLDELQGSLTEFFKDRLIKNVGDVNVHVFSRRNFNYAAKHIWGPDKAVPGAWYDHVTNEIVFPDDYVTHTAWTSGTLLHEGAHALTFRTMFDNPELGKLVDDVRKELVDTLKKQGDEESLKLHNYFLSNKDEFIAGGYENHDFRELLATTKVSPELAKRIGLEPTGTMWDAFRKLVSNILYFVFDKKLDDTMLDAFLKIQERFEKPEGVAVEGGLPSPTRQPELPGITRMEDRPLFERAAAIGLSGKRYRLWVDAFNRWSEARAKLEKAQEIKDEKLRQSTEWKAAFKANRADVDTEVRGRPDFAADKLLREGGEVGGQHVRKQRMDSKLIPEEFKGRIPKDYIGDRGISPDSVASLFGFNNGRSLLTSLARLEEERQVAGLTPDAHLRAVIDAETERRTREQLGEKHSEIMKEIEEHVYHPAVIDMASEEMLHMAEKAKAQLPITGDQARAWARNEFNGSRMEEHSFKTYQSNVTRAERNLTDALLEGNTSEAFKQYQYKVVNMLAANEAKRLEKQQASADKLFKRLSNRIIENLPEAYTNYIHRLMGRGGFAFGPGGIKRTLADLNERIDKVGPDTFSEFIKQIEDKGFPIQIPDFLLTSWAKPQEKMTVDEWRDWSGMIRSLYNIGRKENIFIKDGNERVLNNFIDSTVEQISKHGPELPRVETESKIKEIQGKASTIAYGLIWLESVWNRLDFGNKYGIFNTAFAYPAARAINQYTAWVKEFAKELSTLEKTHVASREILPSIFKDYRGRYREGVTHDGLRQALLYAGTESGYQKLIEGWMLTDIPKAQRTDANFAIAADRFEQWIHDNATKEDWEYVGKIWDINKRIFEKYEGMTRLLDIVPTQKIPLRSMTDKWGRRWDGGYVKLRYDEDEVQSSPAAAGLKGYDPDTSIAIPGVYRASTPRSHEIERTGYVGPLYLKTDRNPSGMTNVLRDAAVRPFIVNTSKAWSDQTFREALRDRGFKHVEDMLEPYLKAVGGMGERIDAASSIGNRVIDYLSRSTVSRLIGWSLTTAAKHGMSAAVNSVAEVGAKKIALEWGTMRTASDLRDLYKALAPDIDIGKNSLNDDVAMYRSQQLQERSKSILETMGGQVARLEGRKSALTRLGDWFERNNSFIVSWADLESAKPTWIAAFKDSITEQSKMGEDVNLTLAEDIADRAVRRAHGSTSMATRPSFMRGNAMAMTFMRLYGFWSSMYQRNYEAMWRTKYAMENFEKKDYQEGLKQIPAITTLIVSSQIAPMIVEYAVEGVPENEKDSKTMKVAKMFALVASSTIPGVREAVRGFLYGYPTTMGILDTGLRDVHDAIKDLDIPNWGAKAFDAEHGGKTIKALGSVFATATRIGNDEINRVLKTLWDSAHRSKETPKTLYELGREFVKGHPREQHRQ